MHTHACTNTHARTLWMGIRTCTSTATFNCLMLYGCCCEWANTVAANFVLSHKLKKKTLLEDFHL